jgi:hypothetical protein
MSVGRILLVQEFDINDENVINFKQAFPLASSEMPRPALTDAQFVNGKLTYFPDKENIYESMTKRICIDFTNNTFDEIQLELPLIHSKTLQSPHVWNFNGSWYENKFYCILTRKRQPYLLSRFYSMPKLYSPSKLYMLDMEIGKWENLARDFPNRFFNQIYSFTVSEMGDGMIIFCNELLEGKKKENYYKHYRSALRFVL